MKQKNILFLLTDDQRYNALNLVGNKQIITPNLNELVQNGTFFINAHIEGGTCGAVCMPSRAMINSGKHLFKLQNSGSEIPANDALMCETFKNNGYFTYQTGKWHNGADAFRRSFCYADDIFFGGMADHWNIPALNFRADGNYPQNPITLDAFHNNKTKEQYADHITCGKHSTDLFADNAIIFLQKHDKKQPFFAYVSFMAPHDPRTMPEKYLDLYKDVEIELPENFTGEHPFDNGDLKVRDELLASYPRNPDEIKQHLKEYYAMVSHLDDKIGEIIQTLKAIGEYDNTIIVLAGDNGLALGSHGLMGKQNLYDHSVRIPLLFVGANIPKNEIKEDNIYLTDIFATLCGLTGIEAPTNIDSKDFSKNIMKESNTIHHEFIYCAYKELQRSVRYDGFKLIEYVVGAKHVKTQLFNLKSDPNEINDLSQNLEYKELIEKLHNLLKQGAIHSGDLESSFGKNFWTNI